MNLNEIVLLGALALSDTGLQVGDTLPKIRGEELHYMVINKKRGDTLLPIGLVTAYDTNKDGIADYEVFRKSCDLKLFSPPNAIHDINAEKIYFEYNMDTIIDEVRTQRGTMENTYVKELSTSCNMNRKNEKYN